MTKEFYVHIIGPNGFQNKLISSQLGNSFLSCSVSDDLKKLIVAPKVKSSRDKKVLILFDCWGMDQESLLQVIEQDLGSLTASNYLVLFNINQLFCMEKLALQKGVRGFLYSHDDSCLLQKMVKTVLSGEIWLPRKKLIEHICSDQQSVPTKKEWRLTKREKDILKLLVEGKSNEAIAGALCLSPHTVKTHLYNLYKKIKVSNRTMASRWALQNL